MTGRERLVQTLRGQRADRMPISPFIYNNNIFEMFGYKPDINTYMSPPDFDLARKVRGVFRLFGFDVLFAPGHVWDCYIPPSAENWEVTITRDGDQDKQRRDLVIKTPEGELTQVIDFIRSSTHLIVLAQQKYIIETRRDFEIFSKYVPPATFLDCSASEPGQSGRGRQGAGERGHLGRLQHAQPIPQARPDVHGPGRRRRLLPGHDGVPARLESESYVAGGRGGI